MEKAPYPCSRWDEAQVAELIRLRAVEKLSYAELVQRLKKNVNGDEYPTTEAALRKLYHESVRGTRPRVSKRDRMRLESHKMKLDEEVGMSYDEIAAKYKVSVKTVKSRLAME